MELFNLLLLVVLQIWSLVEPTTVPTVRLYADVRRHKDFFTIVFPYLMDQLGPHLIVKYNLLGHGIYAAAQMCAVKQTQGNNFLAAYYLKCEAEGRNPQACLCESGIDEWEYRKCVRNEGNSLAKKAYWSYAQPYGSDSMPIIEYGPQIWKPTWSIQRIQNLTVYWDKLCSLYNVNKRPWICSYPLDVKPPTQGVTRYGRCDEKKNSTTKPILRTYMNAPTCGLTKHNMLREDQNLELDDGLRYSYNDEAVFDEVTKTRNLR